MLLLVYHKHTQWPGPGRTEQNVVGYPMLPVYAAKAGGFFFIVFGVTALMGALLTINPVWKYGPYDPSKVTAGSQPDWYMGIAEGLLRIMPGLGDAHLRRDPVSLERLHARSSSLPIVMFTHDAGLAVPRGLDRPATSGSTTCSSARATPRPGPRSWSAMMTALRPALGRRRQRHHRHQLFDLNLN